MLHLLAAAALSSTWAHAPSDDVWVYPHSTSPGTETTMRIWGDGENSVDSAYPSDGGWAYGYMAWDISDLPKGEVEKATLTLYAVNNDDLTADVMTKLPLEVRFLSKGLDEKKFAIEKGEAPSAKPFATAKAEKQGETIKLTVDLLDKDGKFLEGLAKAREVGKVTFALTSKISPAESRSFLYKVYTKEGEEKVRPELRFELK